MNSRLTDEEAIESRLAARLANALTSGCESMPTDTGTRLRFARERALDRAAEIRLGRPATSAVVVGAPAAGALALGRLVPWWQRLMGALPLVVLMVGLFGIDHWSSREQVLAAADIDRQLLADDLPPSAYADPGFAEYLRSGPAP